MPPASKRDIKILIGGTLGIVAWVVWAMKGWVLLNISEFWGAIYLVSVICGVCFALVFPFLFLILGKSIWHGNIRGPLTRQTLVKRGENLHELHVHLADDHSIVDEWRMEDILAIWMVPTNGRHPITVTHGPRWKENWSIIRAEQLSVRGFNQWTTIVMHSPHYGVEIPSSFPAVSPSAMTLTKYPWITTAIDSAVRSEEQEEKHKEAANKAKAVESTLKTFGSKVMETVTWLRTSRDVARSKVGERARTNLETALAEVDPQLVASWEKPKAT